ncbi:Wzz/FepE/Etk N-terminal domain-containing protein [uncultured Tateyamaria sp.]|uniref:GumC family protein n=1 Tax=uncultured Tateyamaria sp. TaxID=455651 RepID=UPI002632CF20|nr:Wzz/FepE/Etk N-terminal domain-containing protein [uncultured Tateyamaria sp.]
MTHPVKERDITWRREAARSFSRDREEPSLDLGAITRAVRRQARLTILWATAGAIVAVLMILGTLPRYTAVETVLLDEERGELLNQVSPLPNAVRSNTAVQSEIEIIRSRVLALNVVDLLELDKDEDFLSPPVGITERVLGLVSKATGTLADLLTPEPPAPSSSVSADGGTAEEGGLDFNLAVTDRDRAVRILRDRLSVSRAGRSLVIQIGFSDFEPRRAAMIARGYGIAYESFQLSTSTAIAAEAEEWLRDRLDVLEQRSIEAAAAVQEFRAANDLVQVRGDLLTEQQQSELASALVSASASAAEAQAQLESMESLLARSKQGEEIVTVPGLNGQLEPSSEALRSEYLDARLRYSRLVTQFGSEHPQAQDINERMQLLRDALKVQLEQATEAARVTYNIARSREKSLRTDLELTTGGSQSALALRGQLQQLEAIAETHAQVYRDYLQRLEVTIQQQGFPIASIKVISPAEIPRDASSPRKKMMLAAGIFLGGLIGVLIGTLREISAKPARTVSELRRNAGLRCAGLLPRRRSLKDTGALNARKRTLERLAQACDSTVIQNQGRLVAIAPLLPGLEKPSAMPAELAAHLSRGGARRVLLIFEDEAQISPATHAETGLEVVALRSVVDGIDVSGGDFSLIARRLREEFDVVLLALRPIADAYRSDPHAWAYDTTLLRIPWGKVSPDFVTDALADHPRFRDALSTTVLEDAELAVARKYMSSGSYEELEINA